jgi:release factor glutamine methyltransferase
MTVNDWLADASYKLKAAGIKTNRLDALVLLEDMTKKDRAYLLAYPEKTLSSTNVLKLDTQIKRRSAHEPLAFIRGKTEFYGREFIINKDVLEPRPETETIIELLKKLVEPGRDNITIVDIGTGSGALAITAKLEFPKSFVMATDIDPKCLVLARRNAKKNAVKIEFRQGDLLEPVFNVHRHITALVCNLPYVPNDYRVNRAAAMEPRQAIYGGPDGLDIYRQLFGQIQTSALPVQYIFTESLPPQHKGLEKIAGHVGYSLKLSDDFIQVFSNQMISRS